MRLPVFVYHDVARDRQEWERVQPSHRPYVLERDRLREHFARLGCAELRCLKLSDLIFPLWGNGNCFIITFDDGHISNYEHALPLLVERRLCACFFVIAGRIGHRGYMGWRELRELDRAGMEIGSHSLTHPFMDGLTIGELSHEFTRSKEILEQGLGRPVLAASLPRGWLNRHVRRAVAQAGYKVFCTSEFGLVRDHTDPLLVPRFPVRAGFSADLVAAVARGRVCAIAAVGGIEMGKKLVKKAVGVQRWQTLRRLFVGGAAAGRAEASGR